jgi:hypothetical protein
LWWRMALSSLVFRSVGKRSEPSRINAMQPVYSNHGRTLVSVLSRQKSQDPSQISNIPTAQQPPTGQPCHKGGNDGCWGDGAASIPATAEKKSSNLNALKEKQRHNRRRIQTRCTIIPSPSRGRALGTGPSRRWGWNRAGPPGPGDRTAAGGGAQKAPRPGGDDGGTCGLTGPGVQTGLFEDQSESPTAPSGRL